MATEMNTESKSVLKYLSENKFLIPMYQRPYTWEEEQCGQLWNDIVGFFDNEERQQDDEYFLGSVVMYKQDGKQNIIDGQQRTTTLSLLLKALYDKASKDKSEEIKQLITNLESCLWDTDDISGKVDYSNPHLQSDVAGDEDKAMLESILCNTYEIPDSENDIKNKIKKSKSNYEKNYLYFICQSNNYAQEAPMKWRKLCVTLLKSCILLPIECKGDNEDKRMENALRIFNTLNNRGIPLSDSDIFKGIIFKNKKTQEERKSFAEEWKELENDNKGNMDFIFRNYMHIIRARNNTKTSEIGLRPFFTKEYKECLQNSMGEITELSKFWNGEYDKNYSLKSLQFYKVLHCLPNEYWKYLDSAYYMYFKDKNDYFESHTHEKFLSRLITHCIVKFIDKPTISVIKPIIFNAYASLYEKGEIDFQTDTQQILENEPHFKEQFFKAYKLIPSLLMLNSYLKYPEQETDISGEIEHIFPKTTNWRKNYTGWDKEEAKPFIESIGNKMWLEKKLNIKASNGYFDDKKVEYEKSKFLEAQDLAKYPKNDWLKEDIEARNGEIYQRLKAFFEKNL